VSLQGDSMSEQTSAPVAAAVPIRRVIHTGMTVHPLEPMVSFLVEVLGFIAAPVRQIPPGPTLPTITGIADAAARVVMVTSPCGAVVELLEYSAPASATGIAPRPCDIGAAHLALDVASVQDVIERAAAWGFEVAGGIQSLSGGPFAGRRVAYIRNAQGFTLELIGA
jgi:glyoxylase I family protein